MLGNPEKNEYICTEKMIGPLRKGDWELNRAPFPDRMVLFFSLGCVLEPSKATLFSNGLRLHNLIIFSNDQILNHVFFLRLS